MIRVQNRTLNQTIMLVIAFVVLTISSGALLRFILSHAGVPERNNRIMVYTYYGFCIGHRSVDFIPSEIKLLQLRSLRAMVFFQWIACYSDLQDANFQFWKVKGYIKFIFDTITAFVVFASSENDIMANQN
ncbi:hypothetical protein GCK72_009055 [Caenorhabditis remanei]|uniref:Uncharacterized protein n=1 Tax=Caenorhabditis remanei TaxID=31234 RepID=A0A6A5H1K7_CAERE|nr:hypothetical protein GCK72_009055 [Caenorhabditis remanei]KAF1760805.1 hypothetical protein GCK72_009055 [Caenorhabditis remanei]